MGAKLHSWRPAVQRGGFHQRSTTQKNHDDRLDKQEMERDKQEMERMQKRLALSSQRLALSSQRIARRSQEFEQTSDLSRRRPQ